MDSSDPLNPFSQPRPSFVGFLNSQTFPYESYCSPHHLNTPKPSGNSKRKETCSQASSCPVGDPEVRPEGIKAAKAKRKNTAPVRSMEECQTVWEMKKDDLLMKERLTKLAILDILLAKNQPLTEAEEVVKNKLLALKWDDIATASHLFQRIIVGIHQTVDTALQKSSSVGLLITVLVFLGVVICFK
ncbi:hypothetical protein YC2023_049838 [Brassica napus]